MSSFNIDTNLRPGCRTSLIAQQLRICLPMQETSVRSLVQEDPTCHWSTKPMFNNQRVAPTCHNQKKAEHSVTKNKQIFFKKSLVANYPVILRESGFPGGTSGKEPACQCRIPKRRGFNPWVRKIHWRRPRQPTPVFLLGESPGERSLAGYGLQRVRHN